MCVCSFWNNLFYFFNFWVPACGIYYRNISLHSPSPPLLPKGVGGRGKEVRAGLGHCNLGFSRQNGVGTRGGGEWRANFLLEGKSGGRGGKGGGARDSDDRARMRDCVATYQFLS